MNNAHYLMRNMNCSELDLVAQWMAAEQWEPGKYDATTFYITDPNGFFVGLLDDKPIASVSAIKYSATFAFMGLYLVLPEYRAQGYGFPLGKLGMAYLQACTTIGCDGVVSQQENYRKSGFKSVYCHVRYAGQAAKSELNKHLTHVKNVPLIELLKYESNLFPVPRPTYLAALMAMPETHGLVSISQGKIQGYGFIRPSFSGYRIGPLFADDTATAEILYLGLCSYAKDSQVFIDIVDINNPAIKLVESHQLKPIFEAARMYRGVIPQLDTTRTYAVSTLEIG